MVDGVIFVLAKKVLGTLGVAAVKEAASWWGARDDLVKLKDRMAYIGARVQDAETRQEGENGELIKRWLQDLKKVLYRADDFFDLVLTVDRKNRKVESSMMKKVGVLFLKPFISVKDSRQFAHKIKSIKEELEEIMSNMHGLNLNTNPVSELPSPLQLLSNRETDPIIANVENVIGRVTDKNTVIRMLFDPKYNKEKIAVFSIVGFGGLGKTTLAQLVYNDEDVKNHFELAAWACVPETGHENIVMRRVYDALTDCDKSDDDKPEAGDENTVMRLQNESLTGDKSNNKNSSQLTMGQIKSGIKKLIEDKKYLLILDDIWDEKRINWLNLLDLLKCGASGSKVIVTTRSKDAANALGTVESHTLGLLTKDESRILFKKIAFKSKEDESNSTLTELGEEIVESCGNVPLAIKVIGCLLYLDNSEKHWKGIRDVRLSKAKVKEDKDITQVLKLSYDYLSPELKQCFAYCALFPKDHRYSKERLVKMWMAQGYIDPSRIDIGEKYFMGLLGRSLFQDPEEDDEGNVAYCKMHDLVHDLAQDIAGEEVVHDSPQDIASEEMEQLAESSNQVVFGDRLLHASLKMKSTEQDDGYVEWEAPESLLDARLMRSLILHSNIRTWKIKASSVEMILKIKSLRVLEVKNIRNSTLPNSIGKLRHLRYLDLSGNVINCLPDGITRLPNLQTLLLKGCFIIEQLPRDFCKLDSLRHLTIDLYSLMDLPRGFEKLTSLEELDMFIVGKNNGINSLPALNLMGNLVIKFYGPRTSIEAQRAELKNSLRLTHLTLLFRNLVNYPPSDWYATIECLQLPPNLKHFVVNSYEGIKMPPKWLDGLSKLVVIRITKSRECTDLPHLSQLPHLKHLYLISLFALEYVEGGKCSSGSHNLYFPSLEVLELCELYRLKGWTRPTTDEPRQLFFPCLLRMRVSSCFDLMSMPLAPKLESLEANKINWKVFESNLTAMEASSSSSSSSSLSSSKTLFTSLKTLDVRAIRAGPASLSISSRFSNLQKIDITSCKELTSLMMEESSSSIRHLGIINCKNLEDILLGKLSLLHTLKIDDCPKMASLPQSLLDLPSLHTLYIRLCPDLITRYNTQNGQDGHLLQHIPNVDIL